MSDYAPLRLNILHLESARQDLQQDANPMAVIWAETVRQSVRQSCDDHLDDILFEMDQMVLDLCGYLCESPDRYPYRDSWPKRAMTRFPWQPHVRKEPARPDTYLEAFQQISSPHVDISGVTFENLARFKFLGWRNLSEDAFWELIFKEIKRLLEDHETLRRIFALTVNKAHDTAGYVGFDFRRQQRDLYYEFVYRWSQADRDTIG